MTPDDADDSRHARPSVLKETVAIRGSGPDPAACRPSVLESDCCYLRLLVLSCGMPVHQFWPALSSEALGLIQRHARPSVSNNADKQRRRSSSAECQPVSFEKRMPPLLGVLAGNSLFSKFLVSLVTYSHPG